MAQKEPSLKATMAGVEFPSPIGVAAFGAHFGKSIGAEMEVDDWVQWLSGHIKAGAGYVYINGGWTSDKTLKKLREVARPAEMPESAKPPFLGVRVMKEDTGPAPYGREGLYLIIAPFWRSAELTNSALPIRSEVIKRLKKMHPDVPIISVIEGLGNYPESYVEGAKAMEDAGADLVMLNLSCPLPSGLRGAMDEFFDNKYVLRFAGALMGGEPDNVANITREVVKAVKIPIGAKLTPEVGIPGIVRLARALRDAGAKFVHVVNGGIGIAPPDIYNRGKTRWPFMNGNPIALVSGSWLRWICYKDIWAIAMYAPGIDILAAGGLVRPEHCVEALMLGAKHTELCTGVIEQGRSLLRRSTAFLKKFMVEQGYQSVDEIIGLGLQDFKYIDDLDLMAGKVVSELDETKCTRCGLCVDAACMALYSDNGMPRVHPEKCIGCGGCILICPTGAFKLVLKE